VFVALIYMSVFLHCCIDETYSDGLGRLCNDEQRKPNAIMKKIVVDRIISPCLFALSDISCGEEIRYDYGPNDGRLYWRNASPIAKSLEVDLAVHCSMKSTAMTDTFTTITWKIWQHLTTLIFNSQKR